MQRERLGRSIFLLSAAFLLFVGAFSYGYFVAETGRFPNQIISQASIDVGAVLDLVRANAHEIHSSRKQGGVTVHKGALTHPGLTFFTAYDGRLFQPFLVDMEGKVVHRWNTSYGVLFKGIDIEELDLVWESRRWVHGAHLYADGSILVSFEYRGMAKLDRCSRPIWLLERDTHHSILPLPDGSFWTLSASKHVPRPYLVKDHREETILHVSADGKVLEEINIIDAILKGGYQAILLQGHPTRPDNESTDPLHLNDIELVTDELAKRIPQIKAGDFLVSLHGPDALAIISRESKAVVWSMVGPFLRQHDPDIVGDGTLLVFDNRTEDMQPTPVRWLEQPQAWGFSRILRLDPATQQVLWSFEGSKAFPFYSSIQGKQQILANGNILVSDPEGGRAFEVSPAHGNQVVWEYVNKLEGKGDGVLGRVTEATRFDFDGSQFLNKPCP
jgi:Arylsulfotransferase (ASST)